MAKIALIPIDNRPVCYKLPKMIIDLAKEHEIIMPDIELMGDLTKPANINGIFAWLKGLKNIDVMIASLDTISYGGLIPSRRSNETFEIIKKRADDFFQIVCEKNIKIYAFSSIMRISNNNCNEEEKEYWKDYGEKIFEYSYNYDKNGIENFNNIPKEILEDYLLTRKRNFELNKYYIELAKKGLFETLVFSKDDCAQYGLNVKEAKALKDLSTKLNNVYIKTGADEIPLTLLSRAININKRIKVSPLYINPETTNKISKYEDISVSESVNSQLELAGGIITKEEDSDIILLVNNFKQEQGELVMDIKTPLFSGEINLPNKPYFIADIVNANGADNNFAKALLKEDLKNFYGYSAWNTTGNTLGSTISAALTYFGAKTPENQAFKKLQLIRFLDDWAYQANIRSEIRNNKDNLTNGIINDKMKQYENILKAKLGLNNVHNNYLFPWNRFFEIDILICE